MCRLVLIDLNEFEIWTEAKHLTMIRKCEYYGAKPFWKEIKKIDSDVVNKYHGWKSNTNQNYNSPTNF